MSNSSHRVIFTLIGFVSRLASGAALAQNYVTTYSILYTDYNDILERAIGAISVSASVGYIVSPLFVSALAYITSPRVAFILYGFLVVVLTAPLLCVASPARTEEKENQKRLSVMSLLCHKVSCSQAVLAHVGSAFMLNLATGGLDTLIALHLKTYGQGSSATALIYSIYTTTYMAFTMAPSYIPQTIPRYWIVIVGLGASSLGYFLIGPPPILPSSLWIIEVGVGLTGFGWALGYRKG